MTSQLGLVVEIAELQSVVREERRGVAQRGTEPRADWTLSPRIPHPPGPIGRVVRNADRACRD